MELNERALEGQFVAMHKQKDDYDRIEGPTNQCNSFCNTIIHLNYFKSKGDFFSFQNVLLTF